MIRERAPCVGITNRLTRHKRAPGIQAQEEPRTMGLDNPIHIAFLLILLLLVFGAKRLPEMGRSLGDGMRGFKDAISGESTPTATTATQPQTVAQPALYAQQESAEKLPV
jgi:sec-independent protein translocase protein TatA